MEVQFTSRITCEFITFRAINREIFDTGLEKQQVVVIYCSDIIFFKVSHEYQFFYFLYNKCERQAISNYESQAIASAVRICVNDQSLIFQSLYLGISCNSIVLYFLLNVLA